MSVNRKLQKFMKELAQGKFVKSVNNFRVAVQGQTTATVNS